MNHIRETVTLETIGNVDVSTVNLTATTPFWTGSETCLFFKGESEVVETYSTWRQAVAGHVKWATPSTLAQWFAAR